MTLTNDYNITICELLHIACERLGLEADTQECYGAEEGFPSGSHCVKGQRQQNINSVRYCFCRAGCLLRLAVGSARFIEFARKWDLGRTG